MGSHRKIVAVGWQGILSFCGLKIGTRPTPQLSFTGQWSRMGLMLLLKSQQASQNSALPGWARFSRMGDFVWALFFVAGGIRCTL